MQGRRATYASENVRVCEDLAQLCLVHSGIRLGKVCVFGGKCSKRVDGLLVDEFGICRFLPMLTEVSA
jgi:hypothetical protein